MTSDTKRLDITTALAALGVSEHMLDERERTSLDEQGWVVLPGVLDSDTIERLRNRFEELLEQEGDDAGSESRREDGVRRLADLVNKGDVFDVCYTSPRVLAAVHHVFGDEFKVSSVNGRDPATGGGRQVLHADYRVVPEDGRPLACETFWVLDDMDADNGAPNAVPGSHLWPQTPLQALDDIESTYPGEVPMEAPAGSVVVLNAHLWHRGMEKRSSRPRRVLHGFFVRRDQKQQLIQSDWLRDETRARLPEAAQYLLDVL